MTDRVDRTTDPLPIALLGAAYNCHRCGRETGGTLGALDETGKRSMRPPDGWELTMQGPWCGCFA